MSFFNDVQNDGNIQESGDSLGGVSLFESNAYDLTIKVAYGLTSSTGAKGLAFEFEHAATGRTYSETFYVTTGKAKECKPYWVDKEGEKHYLKGHEIANAICLMANEKGFKEQTYEDKTLLLWDSTAKEKKPTVVPVATSLIGTKVCLGILKVKKNKGVKGEDGVYRDTNEVRESNEVDKVFHPEYKVTLAEARAGKREAGFYNEWVAKWAGNVKDQFKEVKGASSGRPGAAGGGSQPKTSSLFGD